MIIYYCKRIVLPVPVSGHLVLGASLDGLLVAKPNELRPLLYVAVAAVTVEPPRKVHVSTSTNKIGLKMLDTIHHQ